VVDYFDAANDTTKLTEALVGVIKKYTFLAEDPSIVTNFTDGESWLVANYGDHVPTLLQQVLLKA